MSAEVETMFSANGIRPWHGIGKVINDCPTSEDALRLAGLDWDVALRPAFMFGPNGEAIPSPGCFVSREDRHLPLGYVSDKYVPFQNKQLFDFGDSIIKNTQGIEAKYETAGSLFNGKKVFLLVRLPDANLVGDTVNNYLFICNSHAGKESLVAGITNVRVVCNNTLQLAMHNSSRMWRLRHYTTMEGRQKEAAEALGLAVQYNDKLSDIAEQMAAERVTEAEETRFFKQLFENNTSSDERKEVLAASVRAIYENKDDLQNFRGTKWGLYNAVADYVSNKDYRTDEATQHRQMNRFMFGEDLLKQSECILMAA